MSNMPTESESALLLGLPPFYPSMFTIVITPATKASKPFHVNFMEYLVHVLLIPEAMLVCVC